MKCSMKYCRHSALLNNSVLYEHLEGFLILFKKMTFNKSQATGKKYSAQPSAVMWSFFRFWLCQSHPFTVGQVARRERNQDNNEGRWIKHQSEGPTVWNYNEQESGDSHSLRERPASYKACVCQEGNAVICVNFWPAFALFYAKMHSLGIMRDHRKVF